MKHLKILFVLQSPWGTSLGTSKVHYDLKKEYEKLGHEVEFLDWNKLYPKGQNFYDKILGSYYTERIFKYLFKNANKYDVIDANYNCIPFPKSDYNFKGLVVYRSHGLQPIYRQIEQSASYKRMETLTQRNVKLKTKLGNLYRFLQKKDSDYELFTSIKCADVVHALNTTESTYFVEYGIPEQKIFLLPNGVPDELIKAVGDSETERDNELAFIASWTPRKGINDLNDIIQEVCKNTAIVNINLLGGGNNVPLHSFFDTSLHQLFTQTPHFSQNDLPVILRKTKVGIFPSYVEGFGLAILEQLALGIPVVAYDTPGPADILKPINESLVVKPGDKMALAKRVTEILRLDNSSFSNLSSKCKERAEYYKVSVVARKFINVYQECLLKLN